MTGTLQQRVRQVIEVLPLVALLVGTVAYAWQLATGEPHPRLAQLVGLGALLEIGGAFIDAALAEQLAERPLMRVIGWIAPMALVVFYTVAFASSTSLLDPVVLLIAAGFLIPRFITFVLQPPRDELARRRIKALARDRLEAVFAMFTVVPVLAVIVFVLVAPQQYTPQWLPAAPLLLFVLWLMLGLASTWHMGSPEFARRPQRLLTRGLWPGIVYIGKKGRAAGDEWRAEESAWLADAEAGQRTRTSIK